MTSTLPRTTPHRQDLCRAVAFTQSQTGDGWTIEGYGAIFNSVTTIDSWEGTFDEVIAPSAFRKSLKENTPKMQYDHGRHPALGSLPLGIWTTAEEDPRGLHLIGRLHDNWLVEPFRDAIASGAVSGMSFRFTVVRDTWTDVNGKKLDGGELMDLLYLGGGDRGPLLRTLNEVKVTEAGPVTWPAYTDTEVGVRDSGILTIDLASLHTAPVRRQLARAVFLADRPAEGDQESHSTVTPAAGHLAGSSGTEAVIDGEHSSITAARRRRMSAKLSSVRSAASR